MDFGIESFAEEHALNTRGFGIDHGGLEDAVQDARNAGEVGWLQNLGVFQEAKWIAREVPNATTESDDNQLGAALQYLGQDVLENYYGATYLVDVSER